MYSLYCINMKCNIELIKIRDNKQTAFFRYTSLQTILQINCCNHGISWHENTFNTRMGIRYGSNLLIRYNFLNLCYVNSVCVSIQFKLQYFKFIRSVFKKNFCIHIYHLILKTFCNPNYSIDSIIRQLYFPYSALQKKSLQT